MRMSASCCGQTAETHSRDGFRRVLWAVLAINAAMFAVEVVAGLAAGSASLQADALDFLGDAANYVISLAVVGMALRYRAMAAFAKGATMGIFGLWVIGVTAWHAWHGTVPQAFTMGAVGTAALLANAISFALLWGLSPGRLEHALGMDLHAQRCAREPRGAARGARRVRHRHRLARYRGRRHHGKPRLARCLGRSRPITDRDAGVGAAPTG